MRRIDPWIGVTLVLLAAAGIGLAFRPPTRSAPPNVQAQITPPPTTSTDVDLPAGRKLEGAAWHCWSGGAPCEPWFLTRPARRGETPETHEFASLDGSRRYVIREH